MLVRRTALCWEGVPINLALGQCSFQQTVASEREGERERSEVVWDSLQGCVRRARPRGTRLWIVGS